MQLKPAIGAIFVLLTAHALAQPAPPKPIPVGVV